MSEFCPKCREELTKSERLKKYYCSSCGYQKKFDETAEEQLEIIEEPLGERLTIQEKEELRNTQRLSRKLDKEFVTDCPECGGEFLYEDGLIYCQNCGKNHVGIARETKVKSFRKLTKPDKKIGFVCPICGEKYSVINGEIYCKNCDRDILEGTEKLSFDKKIDLVCPKCKGDYIYDEDTGKIACGICGYQPSIENKEFVIDSDSSEVMSIECDKCGSNAGYKIIKGQVICKSCGDEIDKELYKKSKLKKVIDKDGVVAKRLSSKTIKCINCGNMVEGFAEYKTEFCPSCGTINVVVEDQASLRVEPNKIIPYKLNKGDIIKVLENFAELESLSIKATGTWRQVYVPFWQFHFEGAKVWFKKKNTNIDKNGKVHSFVLEEGREELPLDDFWISAREEFSENMSFDFSKIDMSLAINYSPEALHCMTERYNVGTTEADVKVQDAVYDYLCRCIKNQKRTLKLMMVNDIELNFGTYKNEFQQVLIPTWQNVCEINGENYFIYIEGQNGEIKIAGWELEEKVEKDKTEIIVKNVLGVLSWL